MRTGLPVFHTRMQSHSIVWCPSCSFAKILVGCKKDLACKLHNKLYFWTYRYNFGYQASIVALDALKKKQWWDI